MGGSSGLIPFSGNFTDMFGQSGLGLTGSSQEGTSRVELDPQSRALNQYRLGLITNPGFGSNYLFSNHPEAYSLSPQSQGVLDQAMYWGSQPSVNVGGWYGQSRGDLDVSGQQQAAGNLAGRNIDYLQGTLSNQLGYGQNNLQNTLQNQLSYGSNSLYGSLQGQLGYNNQLAQQMLGAGNAYYNQIVGPQLASEYSLLGLGRSGARGEAEAKAAASIQLPISQQLMSAQNQAYGQYAQNLYGLNQSAYGQYGQGQQNLINQAYSQYGQGLQGILGQDYGTQAGFGQQYLQGLYGLNERYPGVATSVAQSDLGRLLSLYGASQVPQLWQQQGLEGQRNAYISALNATPFTPAPRTFTTGTNNEGILDSQLAGSVGRGAMMGLGA